MKMSTFLQLFLLFDVFLMGVLAATALRHAYAHFRPEPEPEKPHAPPPQNGHLPPAVRQRLLETAQLNFQNVLNRSAAELQHDLEASTAQIRKLLEKHGTEVIGNELKLYRTRLVELQKQAEGEVVGIRKELDEHQAKLRAEMDEYQAALKAKAAAEIEAEKQRLAQQIDTKLADAVASFLLETLQHNVDLGAQSAYLTAMLDEHKADFTEGAAGSSEGSADSGSTANKGVADEAQAGK